MAKHHHEVRDPIHVFIPYDSYERSVIDSHPFQRLRHIHQLGMTYLLYPGATHRRFEHSLGVMEFAGRVYDVITHLDNVLPEIKESLKELSDEHDRAYWKRTIRMAGLCHDLGHLPFSHMAEELLPEGQTHEHLTVQLIFSEEMKSIWHKMRIEPEDIAKLAVGPRKIKELTKNGLIKNATFTTWEALLSDVIVGDSFGVDRIDYLLRDSHHAGVMYGKFDHYRLIDTLRILPKDEESKEPTLGIEDGGIHSAEALLLARYFMFTQVYLHPVRRIYDIHLKDFLINHLPGSKFSTDLATFLNYTDNNVISDLTVAAHAADGLVSDFAKRIVDRNHFRVLYGKNPDDLSIYLDPGKAIYEEAVKEFGEESVRRDTYSKGAGAKVFPVKEKDGRIIASLSLSKALEKIPDATIDFIFIAPAIREKANRWLKEKRITILQNAKEAEKEE